MVYRVLLTQPLAAGPDGDWEEDLLMEGKPATEYTLSAAQLSVIATGTRASGSPTSEASGEQEQEADRAKDDDDEMTVSEDDDDDDGYDDGDGVNGNNDGGEKCDLGSVGVDTSSKRAGVESILSNSEEARLDDSSDDERDVGDISGKEHDINENSEISDYTTNSEESSSTESDAGEAYVGVTRHSTSDPVSPLPSSRISHEYNPSPEGSRVDVQEASESDSSFDGSEGENGSSSDEEKDEYDADDFVPEVPYPPCSLHHQHRKTYKESLCQECYAKYESDLRAAGLYHGSDEEPGPACSKRRKKKATKKKRSVSDARTSQSSRIPGKRIPPSSSDGSNLNSNRKKNRNGSKGVGRGNRRKRGGEIAGGHQVVAPRPNRLVSNSGKADRVQRLMKGYCKAGLSNTSSDEDNYSTATVTKARESAVKGCRGASRTISSRSSIDGRERAGDSPASRDAGPIHAEASGASGATGKALPNGKTPKEVMTSGKSTRSESGKTRTSKATDGWNIPGVQSRGQPTQPRTVHLSQEEEAPKLPKRRPPKVGSEQSDITAPAVDTVSRSRGPQLEKGGTFDAALHADAGAKMRNAEESGIPSGGANVATAPARSTPQVPLNAKAKGTEAGKVGNVDKRKPAPSSHDDSRAGKRPKGGGSNDSAPTSKAGYVRDMRYMGVVQKVTNGKYFVWVDEKLHDGTPYDSAEECAREYDKLHDNGSRVRPWRPKRNFGDAKAPSHVETMGLTPLTSAPGSRMAKPIMSGYRGATPLAPTRQPRRDPPRHIFSAESTAGKQRGHQSGSASEDDSAGKQRGRQPGSASKVDSPDRSSPSVPHVDLPIRRRQASSGCTPPYEPFDFNKVRWAFPLETGRPLDGSFLPNLRDAVPRRSAVKGGRTADSGCAGTAGKQTSTCLADLTKVHEGMVQSDCVDDMSTDDEVIDAVEGKVSPILTGSSSAPVPEPPPGVSVPSSAALSGAESASGPSPALPTASPSVGSREVVPAAVATGKSRTSSVRDDIASCEMHSFEQSGRAATKEIDAAKTAVRPDKECSDRTPQSMPHEDCTSSVGRPLKGDSVPLRDHLAQMRHHASTQHHTRSPWGRAEEKQETGTSGAEERGQEALLRWMHQETESDDNCGERDVMEGNVAPGAATSSPSRPSFATPADGDVQLADGGSAGDEKTLNVASGSAMDEEDEDEEEEYEDLEDLAEYEKLGEQLVELRRDVGVPPSTLPPTASLAEPGVGDDLVNAATPSYVDSELPRPSPVAGVPHAVEFLGQGQSAPGLFVAYVPQQGYETWQTVTTNGDGSAEEARTTLPGPPSVASQPVPSETADTTSTAMIAQDPAAPFSTLACPVEGDTTAGVAGGTAEDQGSYLTLVPAVTWTAPLRLSRSGRARTIEDAERAEVAGSGEPPPVPRVSWRPPARLSRGNSTGNNFSVQSAETGQPEHPRRVNWVTPRALKGSKHFAVAARAVVRPSEDVQCLNGTTLTLPPNCDHSRQVQGENLQCSAQQEVSSEADSNPDAIKKAQVPIKIGIEKTEQRGCDHTDSTTNRVVHNATEHSRNESKREGRIEHGSDSKHSENRTMRSRSRSTDTTRSRSTDTSRSNDTRRSGSSRGSRRSERDHHRESSRDRHGYRRRSPDRSIVRRSPDGEGRDYRGGSRNSRSFGRDGGRGSYWRGDDGRDRGRERTDETHDRYDGRDRARERNEGHRDPYDGDGYGRGYDRRNSHDRESHGRGYREDCRFSCRKSWTRKTEHAEGDWAGRAPRETHSSSRDRSSR